MRSIKSVPILVLTPEYTNAEQTQLAIQYLLNTEIRNDEKSSQSLRAYTGWYSERGKWKKLRSFGMVHKVLKKADGTKEEEYRYYICSIGEDAEEFERAARGHWGVEVKLHWHIKVPFKLDGVVRVDDTHVHKAIREALADCIVIL